MYKCTSKITDDKIESQYLISNASQEDAGSYTCKAITLLDEAEKIVSNVKVFQATRISTEPSMVEVVEGSRLTLDCDLTVSPQLAESLEVFWLKDEARLSVRRWDHVHSYICLRCCLFLFSVLAWTVDWRVTTSC